MKFARAVAAPVPVQVGKRTILLSPPTIRDYGLLMRAIEQLGQPSEISTPPELGGPQCMEYFTTIEGFSLFLWVASRRDHAWTIDEAREFVESVVTEAEVDADEATSIGRLSTAVVNEVFSRNREATVNLMPWLSPREPGKPLHLINFGKLIEGAAARGFGPTEVTQWTLDQLENVLTRGADEREIDKKDTGLMLRMMADPKYREWLQAQRAAEDAAEMAKRRN